MAVKRTHVVMAVISLSFPRLSKLPNSLHIPSRSFDQQINVSHSTGALCRHVLYAQAMQSLDGLKLLSFLLSFILIQFKVRIFQNINLSNLWVSILSLICVAIALIPLLYWKFMFQICLRQVVKYNTTIHCLLKMLLFPAIIILKSILSLLNPVYNIVLSTRPQFKISSYITFGASHRRFSVL